MRIIVWSGTTDEEQEQEIGIFLIFLGKSWGIILIPCYRNLRWRIDT